MLKNQMETSNEFFQIVYLVVKKIPIGKVTTYGIIAEYFGNRGKARHVGYALNSVIGLDIPCHRVVNRSGELSGSPHFETPTLMRELLESEKVEFIKDKVNLKKHLWKP